MDEQDAKEAHTPPANTRTGRSIDTNQMRDILRRVRKRLSHSPNTKAETLETEAEAPETKADDKKPIGPRMRSRLEQAITALETAQEGQAKFVSLTDPDAQMMGEGREKRIRECHSFEAVVDKDTGQLIVGQSSQSPVDNPRLTPLVEAAKKHCPDGISSVDADSGYYSGDAVGELIEKGIDTCIPDSNTAGDLHRGQPIGTVRKGNQDRIELTYDAEADCFRCPEGNTLSPTQKRVHCGQEVTVYRAEEPCTECPQAPNCLQQPTAKHRTTTRGKHADALEEARQRFSEPEHQDRYHRRGSAVETVFGFLRSVLGYTRWSLRGKERVQAEARLFKAAYNLRKLHTQLGSQTT